MNTLDIKKQISDIEQMYADKGAENFGCLIMGREGIGKTSMVATAPLPLLVYMFDPKGALIYKKLKDEKKVLIVPLWGDQSQEPTKWAEFEKLSKEHMESGLIRKFATVSIDSLTWALEACTSYTCEEMVDVDLKATGKLKPRIMHIPFIGDYRVIYMHLLDKIKAFSEHPVNIIMTAHIENTQDKVTEEIITTILAYAKLKTFIPTMFTEKYMLKSRIAAAGKIPERYIMTQPKGRFMASSQLAQGGKLDPEEKPDIKYIMQKAGLDNKNKGDGRYV